MIQAGKYHILKAARKTDFGFYLEDADANEVLLPNRFVPEGMQVGDDIKVFIYHDSENRLTATTEQPKGEVGDIVQLEVVAVTKMGAFMSWGLMKDIFVPLSQQVSRMTVGGRYLVLIYLDEMTGRVAATERTNRGLNNEQLTVAEKDAVDLVVQRRTDLGYAVIINNKHVGLLHYSDIFRELEPGDQLKGFVKKILPDNKIDVMPGQAGYKRTEDESSKILRLLAEHDGYLPYHDKSDPDEISAFFGMSKKTFKMTIGALYKQRKIELTQTGIMLLSEE